MILHILAIQQIDRYKAIPPSEEKFARLSHYRMKAYLQKDGLGFPTVFSGGIPTTGGVQDLVGRDSSVSQSFLSTDHPDDDVRHTVLRLRSGSHGKESKHNESTRGENREIALG